MDNKRLAPQLEAVQQLDEYGLLLIQDARLPSVTTIVAGGPIQGSWWGNPRARGTYAVLVALEDHPDVLQTKLLGGKVTLVHRRLWPPVIAVATSRAEWQLHRLSPTATWSLDQVQNLTSLQTDLVSAPTASRRV